LTHHFTEVGKYQIQEVLGEGAMGVVYRALDPVLNRLVAIKVMSESLAQDADLRERFLREARAAGSLQHPNVITIYDFGEVDGHPFIAMEFVEGVDVEHLLRTSVALSVESKLGIVIDVLQGLSYAHRHGVIHRDIKPANIRVDPDGKARIMDFGIAHVASSNMTRTGVMLGTPNYMAPEQIVGNEITAQTDIFSAGVVLYELLTNTKPFQGDTLHTVLYKVLSETPPAIDKVLPGLPAGLNKIVMRALQKEPKHRYESALEMANELAAIRASVVNRPSEPKTVSLRASIETALASERADRRRDRRRSRVVVSGAVVLATAALITLGYSLRWFDRTGTTSAAVNPAATQGQPASARSSPSAPALGSPPSQDSTAQRTSAPPANTVATQRTPAPTAGELAITRSLQSAALDARRRATTAGASVEQLRAGDSHNRAAESAIRQARLPEAAEHFRLATASWGEAEQIARRPAPPNTPLGDSNRGGASTAGDAAAAANSQAVVMRDTQVPKPSVSAPPSVPTVSPPSAAAPPQPSAEAEIAAVVQAYARAIDAKDIAELRRLYPDMTRTQQRGFEDFFGYTRSLRALLSIAGLQVDGANADARLSGNYEFITTAGKSDKQAVSFRATLRRESGVWRFVSIR
jgi:eukaryotic-like serine/threonine-protein kinase